MSEKIWLKKLHVMSNVKIFATQDSWPVSHLSILPDKQDRLLRSMLLIWIHFFLVLFLSSS